MTKEEYVSFEVAKLLKEKGFEIDTNLDYWKIGEDGTKYFMCSIGAYTSDKNNPYAYYRPENSYPCPTQAMAMRWLREEYDIFIDVGYDDLDFYWLIESIAADVPIQNRPKLLKNGTACHRTYEQAVESAIKYCLENLI